jgi:hypothetical protein
VTAQSAVGIPPSGLHQMSEFDPSEPAILHDLRTDTIVTWTGEHRDDYAIHAKAHSDGAVEWNGMLLDGWGNVLGG